MKKLFLILFLVLLTAGCATRVEYIVRTEYIPIVSDKSLFQMDPLPKPFTKEEFIPFKPKNKDETIALLRTQRDLLSNYNVLLLKDNVMCRVRLEEIQTFQNNASKAVIERNKNVVSDQPSETVHGK